MSQQENPQDPQENSSAPEAESWSNPPASNRPAEGATRVVSLHHAEQTWSAGEGATDFLGLEQDQGLGAPAPAQPTDAPEAAEVNPTQAWLFHMENEARASAGSQAPAPESAAGAVAEWSAESILSEETTTPAADQSVTARAFSASEPQTELEEVPSAVAEAPAVAVAPARKRKVQWLVAASLVATLLAAGGWQIWYGKSKQQTTDSNDPLAWRSSNKKPAKPAPVPPTGKPVVETPAVAVQPPVVKPTENPPTETPTQPEVVSTKIEPPTPTIEPPPTQPEVQPTVASTTPPPEATPVEANPQPAVPAPVDFSPVTFPGAHSSDPAGAIVMPKGTRRPDASEIASLWTSAKLPLDAIGGDSMLNTPGVGAVRVLLKNGEHLQGRLHSVGQGQVCMDIALGRMSVDYSDVSEIVQILDADLNKKPSGGLPEETAGLLYVSAKVPGGYLTGWLVQRTEGKLTLITEQAKKITFDDEGFEPVSKGRARVVGTLSRSSTEAASPAPQADEGIPKLKSAPAPAPKYTPKQAASKPSAGKQSAGKPKG